MDQASHEVEELGKRVEQILAVVRRLADENVSLREQLAASHETNEQLQQRIAEARTRVQAALARLPAPAQAPEQAQAQASDEAAPLDEPVAETGEVMPGDNE